MRQRGILLLLVVFIVFITGATRIPAYSNPSADSILSYVVDPKTKDLQFYWKDDSGHIFGSIQNLKDGIARKHRKLVFAMNGGMFKADHAPVGLFIQEGMVVAPLDTSDGDGNFYLKPNGILFITKENKAVICPTADFVNKGSIKDGSIKDGSIKKAPIRCATQSGPMLLIDGAFHPAFKKGSPNVNIRNGVGILPDNKLVFAMSKEAINFYDFAAYFKSLGCENALYLDGFVSRTYLPEKEWTQTDGNFGVIIGVTAAQNQ